MSTLELSFEFDPLETVIFNRPELNFENAETGRDWDIQFSYPSCTFRSAGQLKVYK
jgi:hypothetical protein